MTSVSAARLAPIAAALLTLLAVAPAAAPAAAAPAAAAEPAAATLPPNATLDDCDAWARREPRNLAAYDCYGYVGRRSRAWDDAVRRLEAQLGLDPDNHWARFGLALLEWDRRQPRARDLAVAAAAGFAAAGDPAAEARARMSIAISWQGVDEARATAELDRAEAIAADLGDPLLGGYVLMNRGQAALRREDFSAALAAYSAAEGLMARTTSQTLQGMVLSGLGSLAWRTGRMRDALGYYEREAEIYRASGRVFEEATVLYNIALVQNFMRGEEDEPGPAAALELFERALAAARRTGNLASEAVLRLQMAQVMPPVEAAAEARHVIEILRDQPASPNAPVAVWLLAAALERSGDGHADEAERLRHEVLDHAVTTGARGIEAQAWLCIGEGSWRRGRQEEAFAAFDRSLDLYEWVRAVQPEAETRSAMFARAGGVIQAVVSRRLSRYLESGDPADIAPAFAAMERGRARRLLDDLSASGVAGPGDGPEARARDAVLKEIAAAQRALADPGLGAGARRAALAGLDGLERRESVLRDAVARADPSWAAIGSPQFPALDEVRAALADGEVMLAYQVARVAAPASSMIDVDPGGSWAIAITHGDVRVARLPAAAGLRRSVDLLNGAIARGDGSETSLARALGADLLGAALTGGTAGIRRVIVLPDGALHRLPFEVLRPWGDGAALGEAVEIVRAPSAATWLRWRAADPEAAAPAVLVVADPDLGGASASDAAARAAVPWYEGLRAGRLPFARREGAAVARRFGPDALLLEGPAASEAALKEQVARGVRFLHVAAHAVVDEQRPRRSAVVLAARSPDEDGLLQPHEIGGLDLRGAVVVLSACSSAAGAIRAGEGVDGLAAAFLRAGARAVVGGLWPLRDADTARFVEIFSAALGRGQSVSAALLDARRALARRGAPAAAWAGLVVIGDGDAVPLPRGGGPDPEQSTTSPQGRRRSVYLTGLILAGALVVAIRASRGATHAPRPGSSRR